MAILFNEKTKCFCLETDSSSYQFRIDEYNYLIHLYYGEKITGSEMHNLIYKRDRGFAGTPYESGNDRTFSLDTLPQEYSCQGLADYRSSCISVINHDGSCAVDLRYKSHKIYKGRKPLLGLPHVFGDDMDTLEISLTDEVSGVEAILYYHVTEQTDSIVRHAEIINHSDKPVILDRALSTCIDFSDNRYDFISFYGKHTMERSLNRQKLGYSKISIGSTRGASGHMQNPFAIICEHDANEDYGRCYGFSFVYSGNFLFEADVDQIGQTRVVMGIHPEFFRYRLEKGEHFISPEVIHTFSGSGLTALSDKLHTLINTQLSRRVNLPRPIVINNWEATYFDFDDEKLVALAKTAAELGIDTLVMDDGWFGKRNDDTSSLGDWFVNDTKIKGGLKNLCSRINDLGVGLGIWFEPEMISENSELFKKHPDWCLNIPNRKCIRSRYQFVLDLTRDEVVDYLYTSISSVIEDTNIRFIKWDFNRHMSTVYSSALPPERQGEVYHRYILGLYKLMERLITSYPDLLIESCSGGGGRFDLGMIYYTPQIWCSDNTDAADRIKIQYGTSFGYPMSAISAHVSVCPNHQTKRITPFSTRGNVASTGAFGYELNLMQLSDDDKETIKKQVAFYKKHEQLLRFGKYYRLTNPFENTDYAAWQFVSADMSQSLMCFVLLRNECNKPVTVIRMKGLEPNSVYVVNGEQYTGSALMHGGLRISTLDGDRESLMTEIEKIK